MSDAVRLPIGLPTRLRAVEVIGRGSSATVWHARDIRAGRDVAVKVLDEPRSSEASELFGQRLELEGRALSRLSGVDGVLEVHELGRTPSGIGWIVSALAPGGSLFARGEASASGAVLVEYAERLAGALAAAHRLEVIHGDITPANVLFDARDAPALADFGLATLGAESAAAAGFTPRFAAPERIRGSAPDRASDVHALASTLEWSWRRDGDDRIGQRFADAMRTSPTQRPSADDWHQAWLELRVQLRR